MITIGSKVKAIQSVDNKSFIQYETGKVIYICQRALVEFDSNICGHNGNGLGKNRFCWMCDLSALKELN